MAYDPTTGKWKDEETSVEKRMTGLLNKSDSAYMQGAKTPALQSANRRGLLNSSMAVQAGEAARVGAALPIASQDASQANQRHMQGRDIQASEMGQKRQITSTEGMATADRGSRENLTREGYQLERDTQAADIGSRERMQGADIASQERMQGLDNQTRQLMQGLDIASQERIAGLNVSTENRNTAARLAAGFEEVYSQTLNQLMNNPEVPAEARQRYMDHAARVRESNLAMVEQLYSIDLIWDDMEEAA